MKSGRALFLALFAVAVAEAQAAQSSGYAVGNIDEGLVIGALVGAGAVVGVGVTFLVLHNRGVVEGCIVESDGKKTLARSGKTIYLLSDAGPSLPIGDDAKLKGHKSGGSSPSSFQVDKILKDYGPCKP